MAIVTTTILAFLACSFVCWFLVASTPRTRWTVAGLLAFCALTELMVLGGWIFTGEPYSVLVILAVVTMIVLISGIVAEERRPGVRPFRFAPLRVRFGTLLSGAYCMLAVAGIVFFVFGVWAFGEPAATPSSAGVLPAPPSLSLVTNADQGCSGRQGPQMVCARQIELSLPAPVSATATGPGPQARAITGEQAELGALAVRTVAASMADGYGWHLAPGPSGTWHACQTVGWFLDKHTVCASVQARHGIAVVTLDVADDW
jgi:hypothetical protein